MNKEDPKLLISLFENLGKKKDLNNNEIKSFLEDVFVKAFQRDKNFDTENPIPEANVTALVDLETGEISIKISYEVVKEVELENRLIHIAVDDKKVIDEGLKVGDTYVQTIDFADVAYTKLQHIKQLFQQKIRESEKHKIYDQFIDKKDTLITAKVTRISKEKGYVIFDKDGVSIFAPAQELSPRDHFVMGDMVKICVLEIEKEAKDAQIIGSRATTKFIKALLEQEIDDVIDGIVQIEKISREVGHKTKVAVSSSLTEVDPVGSIIGIKGQKIKPIIDELKGERIDIIKYSDDLEEYIAGAVLPAKITGICWKPRLRPEDRKEAVIVVEQDQFLPTLGKKGINVKLAAILTGVKLDIKTIETAKAEGIDYKEVKQPSKFRTINTQNQTFNSDEFTSVIDMTEEMEFKADDLDDFQVDFNIEGFNIYTPSEDELTAAEEKTAEEDRNDDYFEGDDSGEDL